MTTKRSRPMPKPKPKPVRGWVIVDDSGWIISGSIRARSAWVLLSAAMKGPHIDFAQWRRVMRKCGYRAVRATFEVPEKRKGKR